MDATEAARIAREYLDSGDSDDRAALAERLAEYTGDIARVLRALSARSYEAVEPGSGLCGSPGGPFGFPCVPPFLAALLTRSVQGIIPRVRRSSDRKEATVLHSTVTKKGQTTIPGEVRAALRIKPGDKLRYEVEGDRATIRVHLGVKGLKGALASDKGKSLSFAQIRRAAAAARRRGGAK
ncbi:MAG: AbrB/MazE/SpoVT family DNA-binding domain-containing protein [Planctomycetia bacterium]|nr:AbrB/MazE/SpoVT family DNA-binding domain-containing protein [Planctomycetia bacterium]